MKKALILLLILILLGVFAAINSGGITQPQNSPVTTPNPTGSPRPDDPFVCLLAEAIHAEDQVKAAEATAEVYRAAVTAEAGSREIEQTRQAEAATASASATQAEAARVASATQAQQTHEANATATTVAIQIINWTATADYVKATSEANAAATVTADYRIAVAKTEVVANAHLTQVAADRAADAAYQARLRENDLYQRGLTNTLEALWPYAVALCAMLMIGLIAWKASHYIYRLGDRYPDAEGRYPLVGNARGQVYDPNRSPYPNGEPGRYEYPRLTGDQVGLQGQVNAGQIVIEVARNSEPGTPTTPVQQTGAQLPGGVNFRVLEPGENNIPSHVMDILDGEWEDGNRANNSDR